MTKRKGQPPIETRRHSFVPAGESISGKSPCGTCGKEATHANHTGRHRASPSPMAHIDTPVHGPRSLLNPLITMQRFIITKDGVMANSRQWVEIVRKYTKLEAAGAGRAAVARARITTADGRCWLVEAREVEP